MTLEQTGEEVACRICRSRPFCRADAGGGVDASTANPSHRSTAQGFVAEARKTVRIGLGGAADFSYLQCYNAANGPIAQLDRVTDFYSVGCRFESCWDRQSQQFQLLTAGKTGYSAIFRPLFASLCARLWGGRRSGGDLRHSSTP
jgi:hypothetical protein